MWKWKHFFDITSDRWPRIKEIGKLKAFFVNIPFEKGNSILKIIGTKYLEGEEIILLCAEEHINSKEFKTFIEPFIE